MKKALLLVLPFVVSCTPTLEEKAEELVEIALDKGLGDIWGYEPLDTQIDSLYYGVLSNVNIRHAGYSIIEMKKEWHEENRLYEHSLIEMSSNDDTQSELERNRYKNAANGRDVHLKNLKRIERNIKKAENYIKEEYKNLLPSHFCNWLIYHTYRYNKSFTETQDSYAVIVADTTMQNIDRVYVTTDDFELNEKLYETVRDILGDEDMGE